MMKRIILISLVLGSLLKAETVEPKPLVSVTASRHLTDSGTSLQGRAGKTRDKTITLRVVVQNVSQQNVPASQVSGDAYLARIVDDSQKLVKQSLGAKNVPELKPNEKVTIDLGEIELRTLELPNRKFEESLEEWKVTCQNGQVIIGSTVSSDKFAALEKEHADDVPAKAGRDVKPVLPKVKKLFKK